MYVLHTPHLCTVRRTQLSSAYVDSIFCITNAHTLRPHVYSSYHYCIALSICCTSSHVRSKGVGRRNDHVQPSPKVNKSTPYPPQYLINRSLGCATLALFRAQKLSMAVSDNVVLGLFLEGPYISKNRDSLATKVGKPSHRDGDEKKAFSVLKGRENELT